MLADLLAMPAVLKAQEQSSTIQLMVKTISHDYERNLKALGLLVLNHGIFCCFLSFSGIMLVHDLTNKKSSQNLYRWSLEALNKDSSPTGVIVSNG